MRCHLLQDAGSVCTHELSVQQHSQPCGLGDPVGQPDRPSLYPANGASNRWRLIAELSKTGEIGRRFLWILFRLHAQTRWLNGWDIAGRFWSRLYRFLSLPLIHFHYVQSRCRRVGIKEYKRR